MLYVRQDCLPFLEQNNVPSCVSATFCGPIPPSAEARQGWLSLLAPGNNTVLIVGVQIAHPSPAFRFSWTYMW